MKKLAILILSLILTLSLCLVACDGGKPDDNNPDNIPEDPGNTPEDPGNTPEDPGSNPENPPAHAHVFGDWVVTKPASCGEDGERERRCDCGEVEKEAVPATEEHTVVTDAAVEATCTETGLTEGSRCSACGAVLTEQKTVGTKPHSLDGDGICTVCHESFLITEGLIYELSEDKSYATVVGYEGESERVVIAPDYEGVPVRYIGDSAFEFASCTSVVIPDGVTRIGNSAFAYCDKLASVVIPNSVTSIGNDAFWGCGALLSVTIPSSVKIIGNDAFSECSSLTSVVIPDSVTTLGEYVFYRCSSLKSVIVGNGVSRIEECAFFYCTALESVVLPAGLTVIRSDAFLGCSSLTAINYRGSEAAWSAITVDEGNDPLATAEVHYNYVP